MRKTKIMATLGPATDDYHNLKNFLNQGVDLVRLNMSHGNLGNHASRIENCKHVIKGINKVIKIFIDLQGPKIRIGKFKNNQINLKLNNQFILDPDFDNLSGNERVVSISYPNLYKDLNYKDLLLLDDGKITLEVELIKGNKIYCLVKTPGILSDNKGINLQGGGLTAETITAKDREDVLFASQFNVDYFGLSFVRTVDDILNLRDLLNYSKSHAKIFAKIETKSAIVNIEKIIEAADGIMIARGDLGVELGLAKLPGLQKQILSIAKKLHKPAIVITQVMDSMINNPTPTRAEVMDLANAVLDGADCIGFSAETAVGKYPELVIKYADEICEAAEKLIVPNQNYFQE